MKFVFTSTLFCLEITIFPVHKPNGKRCGETCGNTDITIALALVISAVWARTDLQTGWQLTKDPPRELKIGPTVPTKRVE